MPTSPRMPRRCRGISLPPSKPSVLTPPSQREAGSSAPAGAGDGFPRQSADWLGMTGQEQGTGTVNGCRGRCPHRPETYDARDFGRRCVGAGFYPARFFTIPPSRLRRATSLAEGGEGKPRLRRGLSGCACVTAGRCGHRPLRNRKEGGGKTAGGRFLARRLSISRKCALHLGESVGIIVEKTDVCSYAGHTSVVT